MHFLIVSGMSGAGKSRAVATLEDLGYYCVDNLPISLILQFAEVCYAAKERYERVALVTDVRAGVDFEQLFASLERIKEIGCDCRILFLDTDTKKLITRYKETRRKHPLMKENVSMMEAIEKERSLLKGIKMKADYVVDTTNFSAKDLRERLNHIFSQSEKDNIMQVTVQSFGFKYGIPADADLVFDVRFLPNPYYEISLREHNGTEKCVRDYVFQDGTADELMKHFSNLMDFLLPKYIKEGKAALVVCIGCTGGKHRSVAVTEALSKYINKNGGNAIAVHRDYKRG